MVTAVVHVQIIERRHSTLVTKCTVYTRQNYFVPPICEKKPYSVSNVLFVLCCGVFVC